MCTAITYQTKDFYFGRTLDNDFSYSEEVVITPRNFPLSFRLASGLKTHYAIIGMAHVPDGYPLYYDAETATEEQYAICVTKGNDELLNAINKVLTKLIQEDKIDALVQKHLGLTV